MRLDKWLWCARFFKTRNLATAAIKTGKIKSGDNTCKASKMVEIGDPLQIERKPYHYDITIRALAKSRGSAAISAHLYHESLESIELREKLSAQMKIASSHITNSTKRPDKRSRRKIIRFTRQAD